MSDTKLKIVNQWRFEFLRDSQGWTKLILGGFVDDALFRADVTDLQGSRNKPQFEKGFQLETSQGPVQLGVKEKWES